MSLKPGRGRLGPDRLQAKIQPRRNNVGKFPAAPPQVNFQCTTTGGTLPGGTFPCAISNYTNIQPSQYTFDLSLGYDTGDTPASDYLKNLGIQLVVQNLLDRDPAFQYRISTGGGNPAAFDIQKGYGGRTVSLIMTKTW